ncbi:MAG: glycosyltransferase family 2 protein [Saprospiraceae bacterium]
MTQISIVVPLYNEADNLLLLYERLNGVMEKLGLTYEYVFVNDGSHDATIQIVRQIAKNDPQIKYLDLSRNFGHQIAATAGLEHSTGDKVVLIDADLQDPPELIVDLYAKMQEGYEVVYAKRRSREGESWLKKFTAKTFYRFLKIITHIDIPVDTGDYRIVDRKVVNVLKQMPEYHRFLRGQIAWIGFNQTYVEYDRDERNAGETGYTYRKMLHFAMDGITAFSDFPLKLATIMGFIVSGVAFLTLLYALYMRLIVQNFEPGWTSIIVSVLFLGGVQLISIGIIGEYISRINTQVKERPLYVVREENMSDK